MCGIRTIPRSVFACDPRKAARHLLGKVLVRREGSELLAGRIVEVEAYLGAGDLAAHAAAGLTDRNRVLFGPPGHAYIYFIYGNYYCLNVSCEREGKAGSLLVRALEPLAGIETMARNRKLPGAPSFGGEARVPHPFAGRLSLPVDALERKGGKRSFVLLRQLTSGPGRLCDAFRITRTRDNDKDLCSAASDLYLADDGFRPAKIVATPRIGITKSAHHNYRYVLAGNPYVSGKRTN